MVGEFAVDGPLMPVTDRQDAEAANEFALPPDGQFASRRSRLGEHRFEPSIAHRVSPRKYGAFRVLGEDRDTNLTPFVQSSEGWRCDDPRVDDVVVAGLFGVGGVVLGVVLTAGVDHVARNHVSEEQREQARHARELIAAEQLDEALIRGVHVA
jgi:hypothetical protein